MEKDSAADGLRGLAALNVFFAHFFLAFFPAGFVYYFPWAAANGAAHGFVERIISTPVLSVFWNGRFPVCLFFVLSGYVLTKSFSKNGNLENVRRNAARRYFRLSVPIFCSVIVAYIVMSLGGYHSKSASEITHSAWLDGQYTIVPNIINALKAGVFGAIINGDASYNSVLWTMRIEFIGSFLIYAYRLLAFPGRRAWLIIVPYFALSVALSPDGWPFYVAFLLGSLIGDMPRAKSRLVPIAFVLLGLFLGAFDSSAVFSLLHRLTVNAELMSRICGVLGGCAILYGVVCGAFSSLLNSRCVQFLGRVSYSFYLLHIIVLLSFSCWIFKIAFYGYGIDIKYSAFISLVFTIPVLLLLAWAFDCLIDRPAVNYFKRLI